MEHGFCYLAIVPVRSFASDTAEMVTQLLFADVFEILEVKPKWLKIKLAYDGYEGWIDYKQYLKISVQEYNKVLSWNNFVFDPYSQVSINNNTFPLVMGTSIPDTNSFSLAEKQFNLQKQNTEAIINIEAIAYSYLGSPYLWGGRSPFGIDCSGFTQQVFKMNNIRLLRDASQQATQGETINSLKEAQKSDLLFFNNKKGTITHVGIYLGDGKIIHASGFVKIDAVDQKGILCIENNRYTHSLCLIKRNLNTISLSL